MFLIGGAIVPYWFSLDPAAFSAWFGKNSAFLGGIMVPLGGTTTLLALATAVFSWRSHSAARGYFVTAAALAALVALIYLLEHASLNAKLEAQALSPSEVEAALRSWRTWHWARVGAGVSSFLAGLLGLSRATAAQSNWPAA
jgi:hypothetical protein